MKKLLVLMTILLIGCQNYNIAHNQLPVDKVIVNVKYADDAEELDRHCEGLMQRDKVLEGYTRLVEQINELTQGDKNKEALLLEGPGGISDPVIRKVSLELHVYNKANLQEARKLLVKFLTYRLELINARTGPTNYLSHYPFTPYGMRLSIYYRDEEMRKFTDGSIASVNFLSFENPNRTSVQYNAYSQEKQDWVVIHEETYEEAERIVNGGD
jgi:hypothetical protein